jgi:hypothetical protein
VRGDGVTDLANPPGDQPTAPEHRTGNGHGPYTGDPQLWGYKPKPAEDLREEILSPPSGGPSVHYERYWVTGHLSLAGERIDRPLLFKHCRFEYPPKLTGAHASGGISLVDCKMPGLDANRLSVDGDLVLEDVCVKGTISLCGARVTGHLRCTKSRFTATDVKSFDGRGMIVTGSALFDGKFRNRGEFVLASARIDGSVDMSLALFASKTGVAIRADGMRVGTGLHLSRGFRAEGSVLLTEAHITGEFKCSGGSFDALTAGGMAIDAHLIEAGEICFDNYKEKRNGRVLRFQAEGEVCLDGGKVAARVSCNGGDFRNPGGIALGGNGLDCRDLRLGQGFSATGQVQLIGARITHELNCTKGSFTNGGDVALNADALVCDGRVYLNGGFTATGAVQFHNARIKTELNCTDGIFTDLCAGGLTCDGNVYMNREFTSNGWVELFDAGVGRELNCHDGAFKSLNAQRLNVGAKFDWRPREVPAAVDVSFADVGLLWDREGSWPEGQDQTVLDGFNFRNLGGDVGSEKNGDAVRYRINWLKHAGYAPNVYHQLSQIYRQKGMSGEAKKISIAGQRDRRKRGGLTWESKWWSRFLDFTVRYGYKMYRPLFAIAIIGVVGAVLFYLAKSHNLIEPVGNSAAMDVNANNCTPRYPCFVPYTYAFELLFPVINLRQVNYWLPSAATWPGFFLLAYVWMAIATGWAISVAVAAGIGHLFSRQG